MAQDNDQNRDRREQSEGYEDANVDQSTREGRSSEPDRIDQNRDTPRQDQDSDLEDTDEMDEDRDDDERSSGGSNRRNNIG